MIEPVAAVLRRLTDVLARENVALAEMDLRRAAALLPEKTAALSALEVLARHDDAPRGAPPIAEARRLAALVHENKVLLERALVAQQRVIGIVVRAAASVASGPSYGARRRSAAGCRPMTLSTRA